MDIGKQERIIQIEPEPLGVPAEPDPNPVPAPMEGPESVPATNH